MEGEINVKKSLIVLLALITCIGIGQIAFAAEDIPGILPPIGEIPTQPETPQTPETPEVIPNMSIEDYQMLNDELGVPVDNFLNSPALGSAGGRLNNAPRVAAQEEQAAEEVMDDEIIVAEAATIMDGVVPIADPATDNTTGDAAGDTATPETTANENQPNPNTGAADIAFPVLTAIMALGAAPIVLGGKKK